MWRTADEIQADLDAGTPERVAAALETLAFHQETFEPVAVAAPTAEVLAGLGDPVPDAAVGWIMQLFAGDSYFEPPLARREAVRTLARLAARCGPSSLALEASLLVKSAEDPAQAGQVALEAIAAPGTARDAEHAGDYVSYLLAGEAPLRAAVVEALAGWGGDPELAAIRARVLGELEDDERARLA
jgi:hypothetical protein